MNFSNLLLGIVSLFPQPQSDLEAQVRSRLEQYIVNADAYPKQFSFQFEMVSISKDGKDPDEFVRRDLLSFVQDTDKDRVRWDALVEAGDSSTTREHGLVSVRNGINLYATGLGSGLRVQDWEEKKLPRLASIPRLQIAALRSQIGLLMDSESERRAVTSYLESRVIHSEMRDGRLIATLLLNNASGVKLEFGNDPEWIPLKAEFFWNAGGKPVEPNKATLEDIANWRISSVTEGVWKRVQDEGEQFYVPTRLSTSTKALSGYESYIEWRFVGWKFGKNVDVSTLEAENFTTDSIRKVSFDSILAELKNKDD